MSSETFFDSNINSYRQIFLITCTTKMHLLNRNEVGYGYLIRNPGSNW